MCNIAGYTGNRRAAPILIDMIRREQFIDGGQSTGIATIHEGKLYTAKVLGDVDALLRETDAINFPGTTGIIHSRPTGNRQSHAHPFTSEDGKLAVVLNGTLRDVDTPAFYERSNAIMQGFVDRGFTIKSAYESTSKRSQLELSNGKNYHDSEAYALMMGDMLAQKGATRESALEALTEAISALPADIVVLGVHADVPDTITVGDVTRPMVVGKGKGETYLATTPMAFPEDVQFCPVLPLPPTSVTTVTPHGATVSDRSFDGVRVQQIDYRIAGMVYDRMEKLLKGQKDDPKSLYDMPCYEEEWRDLWAQPFVDCKYAKEGGLLKPYATVLYDALWSFHKQGRLHTVLGERKGKPITKFWID